MDTEALHLARRRKDYWTLAVCLLGALSACAGSPEEDTQDNNSTSVAQSHSGGVPARTQLGPQPATIVMAPEEVDRIAYVTAATQLDLPRFEILAGAMLALAQQHPEYAAAQLEASVAAIWSILAAHEQSSDYDLAGETVRGIGRRLARIVPALATTTSAEARALRTYASAYLVARRSDVDEWRAVSPTDGLDDTIGRGEEFRRNTWAQLHAHASNRSALVQAIDGSPIYAKLAVSIRDRAETIFATYPMQPLYDFYRVHHDASGGIAASKPDLQALVTAASDLGIARSRLIADNLFEITRAQQRYLDDNPNTSGTPHVSASTAGALMVAPVPMASGLDPFDLEDLKTAIATAQAKQVELSRTLKDVKSGVHGTLWVAATLARLGQDPAFAQDIELLGKAVGTFLDSVSKYSESAIKAAKFLAGVLGVGETGFKVIGAAIFTGGMVAAAFQIASLFGDTPQISVDQQILDQVIALRDLIKDVRREMNTRFDRIDRKLDAIFDTMLAQFELIDWDLGVLNENLEEVQSALYEAQVNLDRLDRNVYAFLDAIERVPLITGIAGWLGYRARLGIDLSPADFGTAESLFYTWAKFIAADAVQAGPMTRSFDDSSLLTELNYPIATNVNYFSELPLVRLAIAPLSPARVANPLTWIMSAESYAQLGEESPALALTTNPSPIDPARTTRLGRIVGTGEGTASMLDAIASEPLQNGLHNLYQQRLTTLMNQISLFEGSFAADPNKNLKGVQLWSGPDQIPNDHYLKATRNMRSCRNGRVFDGAGTNELPVNLPRWNHDALATFMMAGNLGLRALDGCIFADWIWKSASPSPWGDYWTFQLRVSIRIRSGGETIATHTMVTTKEISRLIRFNDPPFDPNEAFPPEYAAASLWSQIYSFPTTHAVTAASTLFAQTRTAVQSHLNALQRTLYSQIGNKLTQAGDPLQQAGLALSGVGRVWSAYVAAGFPLSLAQNDQLRGLLYGAQALLTGVDTGDQNGLLDDVQDLYYYFANTETLPASNIRMAIAALGTERAGSLHTALLAVVARLAATGEREGREPLQPTLTRLYLLDSSIR